MREFTPMIRSFGLEPIQRYDYRKGLNVNFQTNSPQTHRPLLRRAIAASALIGALALPTVLFETSGAHAAATANTKQVAGKTVKTSKARNSIKRAPKISGAAVKKSSSLRPTTVRKVAKASKVSKASKVKVASKNKAASKNIAAKRASIASKASAIRTSRARGVAGKRTSVAKKAAALHVTVAKKRSQRSKANLKKVDLKTATQAPGSDATFKTITSDVPATVTPNGSTSHSDGSAGMTKEAPATSPNIKAQKKKIANSPKSIKVRKRTKGKRAIKRLRAGL